jgi:hypothetical protein
LLHFFTYNFFINMRVKFFYFIKRSSHMFSVFFLRGQSGSRAKGEKRLSCVFFREGIPLLSHNICLP